MNPEEQVDRLIEMQSTGEVQHAEISDEITVRLAVAETLLLLQDIEVPSELAARIELRVRAHSHPSPQQNGKIIPLPGFRARPNFHSFGKRPGWIALLGAAALLVLICVGTLTAAARSLPGELLYGVKQAEYQVQLDLAGNPHTRAEDAINQLRSTLADLSTVVNEGGDQDVTMQAFTLLNAKTAESRAAVADVPAGADRQAVQRDLNGVLITEEHTLRSLLNHTNYWQVRLAFTHQLGVLGDTVPKVSQAIVSQQSNGTYLLTVKGTNFAPDSRLVIDGLPVGVMSQRTSTQLVAVVNASDWPHDAHTVGVGILNPDGAAAQVIVNGDDSPQGGDDHGRHGGSGSGSSGGKGSGVPDDHGSGH
jgi:hypothetical protein